MNVFARAVAAAMLSTVSFAAVSFAETPPNQLVVGFSMSNILTLDPAAITGKETVQVLANIYEGLVSLDPVNRSQANPQLAESWTVSEDNTKIVFKIREGAKFASGNPVTAEDVVWSFKRLMKLNLAAGFLPEDPWIFGRQCRRELHRPRRFDSCHHTAQEGRSADHRPDAGHRRPRLGARQQDRHGNTTTNGDMGGAWLTTHSAGSGPFALQAVEVQ